MNTDKKTAKPASIFGTKNVSKFGYIDEFLFAGEIKGGDHIVYKKARRPQYHLVIVILEGTMSTIINGKEYKFNGRSYMNMPTWSEIAEIQYSNDFHALVAATDNTILEDIFRNRNPFPPDFHFRMAHSIQGDILTEEDISTLHRDIADLIRALSTKDHHFMQELCYAYFYILLTDVADIMWKRYGKGSPSRYTDMKHSDMLMRDFISLLIENIEKETGVSFYAEKLCISKQYLSLIVKDKTRVPVSTIISSLRVDRASRLLRDPDLSIQQIASRLSFSDQSSFGKFFRKHTGMSPLKYRSSLRKTLLSLRPEPSGGKLPD